MTIIELDRLRVSFRTSRGDLHAIDGVSYWSAKANRSGSSANRVAEKPLLRARSCASCRKMPSTTVAFCSAGTICSP